MRRQRGRIITLCRMRSFVLLVVTGNTIRIGGDAAACVHNIFFKSIFFYGWRRELSPNMAFPKWFLRIPPPHKQQVNDQYNVHPYHVTHILIRVYERGVTRECVLKLCKCLLSWIFRLFQLRARITLFPSIVKEIASTFFDLYIVSIIISRR